jgi:monoamine oxidase
VVGGGVAGLNAARLLHERGVPVTVFEGRSRLGGRVHTVDVAGVSSADGFDLGPSWIWPQAQPAISSLLEELGLETFAQQSAGDVVFERMSREPAQRYRSVSQESSTRRVVGGARAVVDALAATLPATAVQLDVTVTGLTLGGDGVELGLRLADGGEQSVEATHVVLAVPPRLVSETVRFAPPLAAATTDRWRATPTWMAPHAKFIAVYDWPFWVEAGYSGSAQSMVGPMLEIHDATTDSGQAALLGFLGISPAERAETTEEEIAEACTAQLVRLFGPEAETPLATLYKDWAADPLTATALDLRSSGHPAPAEDWISHPWSTRLVLAGSETSAHEAGYLAGAVEASAAAVADLLPRLTLTPDS